MNSDLVQFEYLIVNEKCLSLGIIKSKWKIKRLTQIFFYGFVCPQKKIYFAKGFAIHSRNLSNFQNMYRTFLGGYHSTTILSGAQHPPEQQNGNSYITTVNFISHGTDLVPFGNDLKKRGGCEDAVWETQLDKSAILIFHPEKTKPHLTGKPLIIR